MRAAQRPRYQAANIYDFRQTEKFTTDQNRFLEKLFVGFAEAVVTQLAPLLQARFTMELISVKPKSYSGYIGNIPEPTPIIVFRVDNDTSAIIDLDFDLAFAMFEKLMGGKGLPPRDDVRGYLTDLEKGRRTPSEELMVKIADLYQIPIAELRAGWSRPDMIVKEIASLGGDIGGLVSDQVIRHLQERFALHGLRNE